MGLTSSVSRENRQPRWPRRYIKRRSLFEQNAARRNRHGGQLDVGALADHLALELGEGTPDIRIIMRPAGLAVSIASVSERNLLPAASTRSRIVS